MAAAAARRAVTSRLRRAISKGRRMGCARESHGRVPGAGPSVENWKISLVKSTGSMERCRLVHLRIHPRVVVSMI
jgi:hypothetical protein